MTSGRVTLRLVRPGPDRDKVLAVLSQNGCPDSLASDYLEASSRGAQPVVLLGANADDALSVRDQLQAAGAEVATEEDDGAVADLRVPKAKASGVEVMERYLDAYNKGDAKALGQCLSATAVLSDASGGVLVEGAEAIMKRMDEIFSLYPDRKVTVAGRLVAGPWVLDHHRTTFGAGRSEETVLCLRVDDGRVQRIVLLT